MHRLFSFFILCAILCAPLHGQEKKRYILYAAFLENTPVQLADGAKWMMDKGDTFPVMMFKEQQTQVILQLAGTNFRVETSQVKIFEGTEITPAQLATYRANVKNYIESRSEKWKDQVTK